ncbi:MAG: N-formylglutamate amidohydrolase [Bdellovibrionales bacterium]|nr:N-formylglutamate amidohydrolase [Bdellovibrionales bacterium]
MSELFLTIPHSGRKIPPEAFWLKTLPQSVLCCDVDAFVDELYAPTIKQLNLTSFLFPWHRYAVDVNRFPEDRTCQTVEGAPLHLSDETPSEIHWHKTTKGDFLIKKPLSKKRHQQLINKYYNPFHRKIQEEFKKRKRQGSVYLLDLHSMPSIGEDFHRDRGQKRAQIVIGNRKGHSSEHKFLELVLSSYKRVGFEVVLNQPYQGGRITEFYGSPKEGQHALQVEINRSLYMKEGTNQKTSSFSVIQNQLNEALMQIVKELKDLNPQMT